MIQKQIIYHKQVKRQICKAVAIYLTNPGVMHWCKQVSRLVKIGDLSDESAIVTASDKWYPLFVRSNLVNDNGVRVEGFVSARPDDDPKSVWLHGPGSNTSATETLVSIGDLAVELFDYESYRDKWMQR